jgi:hypothetical protein
MTKKPMRSNDTLNPAPVMHLQNVTSGRNNDSLSIAHRRQGY